MPWQAIWKSIVLGIVQGLTEFLPVSSSGHLSLLHRLLGADFGGNELFVDIMLHVGTLIAVCIVMRKDILKLFQKPFKLLFMLIVATVPAGIIGLLFDDKIDELFNGAGGILYLALCFSVTAVLLMIAELASEKRTRLSPLGWKNTVPMGLMQALALFPGISRSGSTITAGIVTGAKRNEVASFSFLMSIPVILGSALVKVYGLIKDVRDPLVEVTFQASDAIGIAVGVVFAAISGFLAIKFMLKVIEKANYKWFSFYLIALSIVCVTLYTAGVLV